MEQTPMTPNQPYLLKAFFDWIVDNDLTPYIVVNANHTGVQVPVDYVKDGQIVLNVSPSACAHFQMDYDSVSFQARFGGQPHRIYMPSAAIVAIYARENGAGTVFTHDVEETPAATEAQPEQTDKPATKGRPSLKVVK